ncbi:MAG: hypothetical protein ACLRSW_03380 [Christensenellaceae bacterium]
MKTLYAADAMRAMGYPFTVLEMELGSYADIPPVLPEDLRQWYMLNLGLGMKGVSYYIFAGGANPEFSGMTTDVYDFQAPVSSDGKIRKSYQTLKNSIFFMKENEWLLGTERIASVQVGVEWQTMRGNDYAVHAGVLIRRRPRTADQVPFLFAVLLEIFPPFRRAYGRAGYGKASFGHVSRHYEPKSAAERRRFYRTGRNGLYPFRAAFARRKLCALHPSS